MTKKNMELKGKRTLNLGMGWLGRVVDVRPHGKTSCRVVVLDDGAKFENECTLGDFHRNHNVVSDAYVHGFPSVAQRLRELMRVVDEECGGKIPYRPGNFTEIRARVMDSVNRRTEVDSLTQASPFGDRNWTLAIHLWGRRGILEVQATREELQQTGGWTWPAFRKKMLTMIEELEKKAEGVKAEG
jgi:hypothetical protein